MEEYALQRVTERTYWVSRHFYGSLFYVGARGMLLLAELDNHYSLYLRGRQIVAGRSRAKYPGAPARRTGPWPA